MNKPYLSYHQLRHLATFISKCFTRKFYKSFKAFAIREIKHLARSLNANKALGFASCFISISAAHLVLYFTYVTHGNALSYTYWYEKGGQVTKLIILVEICYNVVCDSYFDKVTS